MNTEVKLIKTKLGLLNLSEQLGNVSQACKIFGYSRDSFYRFKELYEQGSGLAPREVSRRKPNFKNWIEEAIEEQAKQIALDFPAFRQVRAWNELKKGVFISPAGICCVWLCNDMETYSKRLKLLEKRAAQEGLVLTETQVVALEKAKEEKQAQGDRDLPSGLSRGSGHLLRWHNQRSWKYLSTNLYRYLCQSYPG